MRVLVTGGRGYDNEEHIRSSFLGFIEEHGTIDELIVGDATGADSLAKVVAQELGIPVTVYEADWKAHGIAAGFVRNQLMVDTRPDFLMPFAGGNGTRDCVARSQKAGGITLFLYLKGNPKNDRLLN